jgi:hypothetical protein
MLKIATRTTPFTFSIAACTIALATSSSHSLMAAAVTIDPSQVVLVESSHNPSKESETIRSAVALPGGGIFATGIRDHEDRAPWRGVRVLDLGQVHSRSANDCG